MIAVSRYVLTGRPPFINPCAVQPRADENQPRRPQQEAQHEDPPDRLGRIIVRDLARLPDAGERYVGRVGHVLREQREARRRERTRRPQWR